MKKEIICTICPIGCNILVEGEGENIISITGNQCNRGFEFAKNEFLHPVRILTTSVKVINSSTPLLPVRSNKPIPKELIMDCMKIIKEVELEKNPIPEPDPVEAEVIEEETEEVVEEE